MLLLLKLPMSKITKAKECVRRLIRDFFPDWLSYNSSSYQIVIGIGFTRPHFSLWSPIWYVRHMNIKIRAQLLELASKEVHILFLGLWYALRSSPIIGIYSATERTLSVRASTHPCSWASSLMSRLSWSQQEQQEATSLDSKSHSLWKRVCHWALMRW